MLTNEIEIIKCHNQNMVVLLNIIATRYKSLQMHRNMGSKLIISSGLGYVSNILSFPLIICVDKQSSSNKISSR